MMLSSQSQCPNILDFLAFCYSQGVPLANFPSFSGIATGGDVNTLSDTVALWQSNQWTGYALQDRAEQCDPVLIASNTGSPGNTLTFVTPLSQPVQVGDAYLIASPWLYTAFLASIETVNELLSIGSARLYILAVYNLGLDRLLNYAPDVPNQSWFKDQRTCYGLHVVKVGVPSSVSDQGTASGILNPEFMENMTLQDLQTMKTPFGRRYMEIAQDFGSTPYGMC